MRKEIVFCKALQTPVNKEFRCPDKDCDTCQEVNITTEKTARHRTFTFTDLERKVLAKKDLSFALRVYNFLNDLTTEFNESEFRKHYWNFLDLISYLKRQNLYLGWEGNEFETYIEDLDSLYALISRHIRQKKNIPLDCLLITYRCDERKINTEALAKDLREKRITNIEIETLQRRISRARDTKYLWEITNLAIKLMPFTQECYEMLATSKFPNCTFRFLESEP
jgi:hypothetical protein